MLNIKFSILALILLQTLVNRLKSHWCSDMVQTQERAQKHSRGARVPHSDPTIISILRAITILH